MPVNVAEKLHALINLIESADNLEDIDELQIYHLHLLHGQREGQYALDVAGRKAGYRLGTQREVAPFDKKKLLEVIPEIRSMTVQNPKDFYPRLREALTNCGVALVLLPNLKNCGVNGAVKWLGKYKVILALNDRRKYADTFWFALFHELGHVLQQRVKVLLVSEIKKARLETDALIQRLELDADTFSQNTLIPKAEYDEFIRINTGGFTAEAIKDFSARINVLPGIVVGRLQHDGYLTNQTTLNSLKIKYVIG